LQRLWPTGRKALDHPSKANPRRSCKQFPSRSIVLAKLSPCSRRLKRRLLRRSVALQHAAAGRPIDGHTKEKAVHPISSTRKSLQSDSGIPEATSNCVLLGEYRSHPAMSDSTELVEVSSILTARDFCGLGRACGREWAFPNLRQSGEAVHDRISRAPAELTNQHKTHRTRLY